MKSVNKLVPQYSVAEEIANVITHGIGLLLSVAALTSLLFLAIAGGNTRQIVSVTIFGISLFLVYLASTLYHLIQHPPARHIFRIFDHAAIYLLIAGTYTPFLLISLGGTTLGFWLLIIVWAMAICGVFFKIFFIHRFQILSTIAYVLMGWLCVVALKEMIVRVPAMGIGWLVAGGIVYTAGVIFYATDRIPFNHAVWHLFVLGGSICHFVAVSSLII